MSRTIGREEIRRILMEVVTDYAAKGPGWAQEGAVLQAMGDRLRANGVPTDPHTGELAIEAQQAVLDCWYELFDDGTLGWGLDLDNPGAPFFRLRKSQPAAV